jgi:hypothetical protein
MSFVVQQADLDVALQEKRTINIRAELLNHNFQTVESLEGEVVRDDYSIDADSDIRRTYNVSVVVNNSTFHIGRDTKIWFDKYIRITVGLFDIREQVFRWYPIGLFIFSTANYNYDSASRTLTLSCVDITAKLTGLRNGQLSGLGVSIPAITTNNNGNEVENMIRSAIKSAVTQLGGISKFRIEDVGEPVPYDLHFSTGTNVWEIITTLRDLYPGWETYFDDELFICQPIPLYLNEPIVLDAEHFAPFVISEDTSVDFSPVKNVTEVWGRCLSADYFTENSSMNASGIYQLTFSGVTSLSHGTTFGFVADRNNIANARININNFDALPILGERSIPIAPNRIKAATAYVVRYVRIGNEQHFYFQGEHQVCAVTKLVSEYPSSEKIEYDLLHEPTKNISYIVNPDSPFCSDFPDMGEIRNVLSDGEYNNIYSSDLAIMRAEYENWRTTDLLETINLSMVDLPILDVNSKIEYHSHNLDKIETYLVKRKSGSTTAGQSNVTLRKFQPIYPWLRE